MKRTFTITDERGTFDATFTEVTAVFNGERMKGLFVEESSDEFGNGSGIMFDREMPDDAEEALILLIFFDLITDFEVLNTMEVIK